MKELQESPSLWLQNALLFALIVIPLLPSYLLWLADIFSRNFGLTVFHPLLSMVPWLFLALYGLFFLIVFRQHSLLRNRAVLQLYGGRWGYLPLLLLLFVSLAYIGAGLFMPLYANDPSQYAMVSRMAQSSGGFSFYPMHAPVADSGFLVYMTHPLGYPANILAHWSVIPSPGEFGFAKIISIWFGLSAAVLLLVAFPGMDISSRLFGALVFLLTPLFGYQVVTHGVDPAIVACAVALAVVLSRGVDRWLDAALAALLLGLLLFSHSMGIVVGALLMASYLFFGPGALRERLLFSLLCGSGGLLLGGYQYLDNFLTHGSPLSDQTPIWGLPELARDLYMNVRNGMDTPARKVLFGLLMPFTDIRFYGVTAWAALLLSPFAVRSWGVSPLLRLSLSFVMLYWGLIAGLLLVGNDTAIRGSRYFLPLIPFLAMIAMSGLQQLLKRYRGVAVNFREGRLLTAFLLFQFLPVALAVITYLHQPSRDLIYGDQGRFDARSEIPDSLEYILYRADSLSNQDDNLLLTFRMDRLAYYTDARFIRYLDRRLLSFYRAQDRKQALDALHALGITHVFVPDYSLAELENSWIRSILGDLRFSRLIIRNRHGALYEIYHDAPKRSDVITVCYPWYPENESPPEDGVDTSCDESFELPPGRYHLRLSAAAGESLAFSWTWHGKAHARVSVRQTGRQRNILDTEIVLSPGNTGFSDQVVAPSTAGKLILSLTLQADAPIEISALHLQRYRSSLSGNDDGR